MKLLDNDTVRFVMTGFFILIWTMGISCSCAPTGNLPEAQEKEFAVSDNVIIGEIVNISDDERLIILKVKEIFKGNLEVGQVIKFKNNYYCEPFIDMLGEWLIYSKTEEGELKVNECGLSRSLIAPEQNRYFMIPLPPRPPVSEIDPDESNRDIKELRKNQKQTAIIETEKELQYLRKKSK